MRSLTPLFSTEDIKKWGKIFEAQAEKKILLFLQAGGERFVKYARENGSYEDRTGNLRSSIGYIIVKNGDIVMENFKASKTGSDRKNGLAKAKQLAEDISLAYPEEHVLIGVVGMEYAFSVESKGYEVATGSSIQVENWMRKALTSVFNKAKDYG